MALTQAADSIVQGLTVSVLPSLNSLVILASYVKLNFPASLRKNKVSQKLSTKIINMQASKSTTKVIHYKNYIALIDIIIKH